MSSTSCVQWWPTMPRRTIAPVLAVAALALAGCSSSPPAAHASTTVVTVTVSETTDTADTAAPDTTGATPTEAPDPEPPTTTPPAPATTPPVAVPVPATSRQCMAAIVEADYIGKPEENVASVIRRKGFTTVTVRTTTSDQPAGTTVRIAPLGSALPCSAPITVWSSSGPAPMSTTTQVG